MYLKLVLILCTTLCSLLKAQAVDSLSSVDSLSQSADTVYVQQPPLVIKRQVVIHDTLHDLEIKELSLPTKNFKILKELSESPWYISAEGGLDPWLGNEKKIDSNYFKVSEAYSYSASIGKELYAIYLSAGVGMQQRTLHQEIEKLLIHYDSTVSKETFPVLYPDGSQACITIQRGGKTIDSCLTYTITTVKYDTTYSNKRSTIAVNHMSYLTFPLKLGKRFQLKRWYIAPELWIIPMFTLNSNALGESQKPHFNSKLTAYKLNINIGRQVTQKLSLELAAGYQGTFGHPSIDMKFLNLHFGLKYYLSRGTP